MRDERAEDGVLIRAYRLVRKGRVKFGGRLFTHPSLSDHEGRYIPVTWSNFWMRDAVFDLSRWESITLNEIDVPPKHE
jgi:hypothetical protein